ncbi:MAG: hypothetical protein ABDH28_06805 [Brevinematia bacterium]
MKNLKHSFLISLLLIMFTYSAFCDVLTFISSNTYINWTKGMIVSEFSGHSEFLIGEDFHRKILDTKYLVKKKIISELLFLIKSIPFDENRKVEDLFLLFPEKRKALVSLLEANEVKDFRYFGGKVLARYTVGIYGQNGIFNILRLPSIPRDYREFINQAEPKEYTGLLISTKNQKFNISLSVKILSKSGKLVYSYADYRGKSNYIHFFRSLKDAIDSGIFGNNIIYTTPLKIEGENLTDIVLDDSVVEKILTTSENHNIFFDGKVGIILGN